MWYGVHKRYLYFAFGKDLGDSKGIADVVIGADHISAVVIQLVAWNVSFKRRERTRWMKKHDKKNKEKEELCFESTEFEPFQAVSSFSSINRALLSHLLAELEATDSRSPKVYERRKYGHPNMSCLFHSDFTVTVCFFALFNIWRFLILGLCE